MEIAESEGVQYVYLGNVSGNSDTVCSKCGRVVIHRHRLSFEEMDRRAKCKNCGAFIVGRFD